MIPSPNVSMPKSRRARGLFSYIRPKLTSSPLFPDSTYAQFALHLHTNTIGPIICAQALLNLFLSSTSSSSPNKLIFISSDSGSATLFRDHEDGFGAYAASKAALNQMVRHLAAELKRKEGDRVGRIVVLAMHPGEVAT